MSDIGWPEAIVLCVYITSGVALLIHTIKYTVMGKK